MSRRLVEMPKDETLAKQQGHVIAERPVPVGDPNAFPLGDKFPDFEIAVDAKSRLRFV